LPVTGRSDVNTAVVQDASSGPYRRKVMVPVGAKPPERVALSLSWPPTVTGPDAWVTRVGTTLVTTTDSLASSHDPDTAPLTASPP
jgi:hypothetical protein